MNKITKPARTPSFFITELAEVHGGTRRPRTTFVNREEGTGTTRTDGEEGHGGGLEE